MELAVKRHFKVDFFNKFDITLRYDAVASSFTFQHYFDPSIKEHRVLWQPGHYHQVDVTEGGELLTRGFVLSQVFGKKSIKKLASITGYTLCGVLEDCQIPTSVYPLQSDGKTLLEIATRLVSPFPFKVVVDSAVTGKANTVIDKTTASETESIKQYLTKIAAQLNLVLSHTPEGNLLITEAKTKSQPIFHFEDGTEQVTDINLSFSGQGMHSQITVMKQQDEEGGNAGQNTIKNPYVPFVFRPAVKTQSSGTDNETSDAARKALSAELKGIKVTIELSTWYLNGNIVKPNQTVTVLSPENYLFKRTKFFIESVKLKGDEKVRTAVLTCVLPEVYNNGTVKNIFEVPEANIHD